MMSKLIVYSCSSLQVSYKKDPSLTFLTEKGKVKCEVHPCTGTEALYRPTAYMGSRGIALLFLGYGTRRG